MSIHPFSDEPIDEVQLLNAPLVKVLVQMRFPTVAALDTNSGLAGFQDALNDRYPTMSEVREQQIAVSDKGPVRFDASTVRLFVDPDVPTWTVALAPDFVALETSGYTDRTEFTERWREVLMALAAVKSSPRFYNRLGVRYINRLVGDEVDQRLPDFVRPEVLGALALSEELRPGDELIAAVTQANFLVNGIQIAARWGKLPPGGIAAPGLEPVAETSWILDTDVFTDGVNVPFDAGAVVLASESAAARAYRFFRWVVTDEFLRQRGGQL